MSVIRGTALAGFPQLTRELGGDPDALLRAAGLDPEHAGEPDVFISYRRGVSAMEAAAVATRTPDFGRRLAERQGIAILGPVGAAARTAATAADALQIFSRFLCAYGPAVVLRTTSRPGEPGLSFIEFQILLKDLPPCPQTIELSLGVTQRILGGLFEFRPVAVHLPHDPLTAISGYQNYFNCRVQFGARQAGFVLRSADLTRELDRDDLTHEVLVRHLMSLTATQPPTCQSIRALVRQLLPSGQVTLELIAGQLDRHPKSLQRRLAQEKTSLTEIIDDVRRETADHYLRTSSITLSHLAAELGYAEQSALTRACRRWFGLTPRPVPQSAPRRPLAPEILVDRVHGVLLVFGAARLHGGLLGQLRREVPLCWI